MPRSFVFGLVVLAVLVAGCFGPGPVELTGVDVKYWNESNRNLRITLKNGPSESSASDLLPPSNRTGGGGVGFGCETKPEEEHPFQVILEDVDTNRKWDYRWSDIGCGVKYEFVYHADGSITFKLIAKNPAITKTDLPRK